MQRRSFLTALGALIPSIIPITRVEPPALPVDEDSDMWWRYVQHAIKVGDPKYCTEKYLDMVVKRSNLDNTTDREARRVIRAAFRGVYDHHDVPVDHRLR